MALETITRCTICKREDCDGQEYIATIEPLYPDEEKRTVTICSSYVSPEGLYRVPTGTGTFQKCLVRPKF